MVVKKEVRNDVEYLIKTVMEKYNISYDEAWSKIYFHVCKLL